MVSLRFLAVFIESQGEVGKGKTVYLLSKAYEAKAFP
jgi:hypothetical protein